MPLSMSPLTDGLTRASLCCSVWPPREAFPNTFAPTACSATPPIPSRLSSWNSTILLLAFPSDDAAFPPRRSLTICYNRWDLSLIDFEHDVEAHLAWLARNPKIPAHLVELIVTVYFLHIRARLDGSQAAMAQLNAFLDGPDHQPIVHRWWPPSLLSVWALPAAVLGVYAITRLIAPHPSAH